MTYGVAEGVVGRNSGAEQRSGFNRGEIGRQSDDSVLVRNCKVRVSYNEH